jgi:hypothetical protein
MGTGSGAGNADGSGAGVGFNEKMDKRLVESGVRSESFEKGTGGKSGYK